MCHASHRRYRCVSAGYPPVAKWYAAAMRRTSSCTPPASLVAPAAMSRTRPSSDSIEARGAVARPDRPFLSPHQGRLDIGRRQAGFNRRRAGIVQPPLRSGAVCFTWDDAWASVCWRPASRPLVHPSRGAGNHHRPTCRSGRTPQAGEPRGHARTRSARPPGSTDRFSAGRQRAPHERPASASHPIPSPIRPSCRAPSGLPRRARATEFKAS